MTAWQIVGTWAQLVGVLIALIGLASTYRRYAPRGTLKRAIASIGWRVLEALNPRWRRRPRLRIYGAHAWGPEADTRSYELPSNTDEALRLLASYIEEDRAMLLLAKAESGHALHELGSAETRQRDAVDAGVRDYALGGLAITALGLILTALGIALTLW